ncbi:hypothetical protein PENTCL1PPCAC_16130, partial [Pristionchus entomophagus]
ARGQTVVLIDSVPMSVQFLQNSRRERCTNSHDLCVSVGHVLLVDTDVTDRLSVGLCLRRQFRDRLVDE